MFLFNKINQIRIPEAKELIKNENPKIIDIRSIDAYNRGYIDGAVWVNNDNVEEVLSAEEKTRPILCYCYKGISSIFFCKKLKKDGYENVYSLIGGFDAWPENPNRIT